MGPRSGLNGYGKRRSRNVRRGAARFVKALVLLALRATGGLSCQSF